MASKRRKTGKVKMVLIEWRDATSLDDTMPIESTTLDSMQAVSVGLLLAETPDDVTLYTTLYADMTARHLLTVPRGMIQAIHYLKER